MKIKKKHIRGTLLTLMAFHKEKHIINGKEVIIDVPFSGLLLENIGLGVKRKLQKIRNELLPLEAELTTHEKEIEEKFKDNPEQLKKEFQELEEEEVTLQAEPAMISEIEKIQTDKNYDFELIEMIAQ